MMFKLTTHFVHGHVTVDSIRINLLPWPLTYNLKPLAGEEHFHVRVHEPEITQRWCNSVLPGWLWWRNSQFYFNFIYQPLFNKQTFQLSRWGQVTPGFELFIPVCRFLTGVLSVKRWSSVECTSFYKILTINKFLRFLHSQRAIE